MTHLRADQHGRPLAGLLLPVVALLLLGRPVAVLLVVGGDGALLVVGLDRVGLSQTGLRHGDGHLRWVKSLNLSISLECDNLITDYLVRGIVLYRVVHLFE